MTAVPSVSVIIPTCDRPEMLEKSVASVLAQDYAGITQIIITDDGSGSGAEKFAEELKRRDGRILYSRNTRYKKGPAGNKQNGAELASADFLAFLDDDDTLLPDAISSLAAQTGKGFKVIMGNCERSDNGDFTGRHYSRDEEVSYLDFICGRYEGEYFGLIHRDLMAETGFLAEFGGFEAMAWLDLYKRKKIKVYYRHKAVRVYNVHPGQYSNAYEKNAERTFLGYSKYLELFGEDLKKECAGKFIYLNRLAAYFAMLSGRRKSAAGLALKAARAGWKSPFSWLFLLICLTPAPARVLPALKRSLGRLNPFSKP